jgi:hypothetical protein
MRQFYEWNGQRRHELYLVYDVDVADRAGYAAEQVKVVEPDGTSYRARSRHRSEFRSGTRLARDALLALIRKKARSRWS